MILAILPKLAFLPRRTLDGANWFSFVDRRDKLFSLCTAAEQQCLIQSAEWYGSHRDRLLAEPNIFSESFLPAFNYRYFSWLNPKPNPVVLGLARIYDFILTMEQWRSQRLQSNFIARLHSLPVEEDVLLGVIHFFRVLPLEIGFDGVTAFQKNLDLVARKSAFSHRVSAARRFDAARRCLGREKYDYLRHCCWALLLEVAQEDEAIAARLVDEHWNRDGLPSVLTSQDLHETPELAYKLAVKLNPVRTEFAADMLRLSIYYSSFQLKRLDGNSAAKLEQVMDASCQLLGDWTLGSTQTDAQSALKSISHLFQFGNPEAAYWSAIPKECLEIVKGLDNAQQDKCLQLLTQVAFYADKSCYTQEAIELFKICATRTIGASYRWEWSLEMAVRDICRPLSILENKTLSLRNRRIPAKPDHHLLAIVDGLLGELLKRLQSRAPEASLNLVVSMLMVLSNETLIRKQHQILRDGFEKEARSSPASAGVALKKVIQYCGYSQSDDEMYKRDLCRESFDLLVPILDRISPADAAVTRSGIGWSPMASAYS